MAEDKIARAAHEFRVEGRRPQGRPRNLGRRNQRSLQQEGNGLEEEKANGSEQRFLGHGSLYLVANNAWKKKHIKELTERCRAAPAFWDIKCKE
ncbi:unnamed protein product [Nezara viridula]|uniref:Uncharacterized protein n=1 Tax=Nezara viridula TaxID=85310 RepID=A0A9P0H1U4_NEZVI|nr:unnamed protein product [Nezara viridula]